MSAVNGAMVPTDDGGAPYTLVRSDRRTLALTVTDDGALVVKAPMRAPLSYIEEFVKQNRSWIEKKQKKAEAFKARYPKLSVAEGDKVTYLGAVYTVKRSHRQSIAIEGSDINIPDTCDLSSLAVWLRGEVLRILAQRVAFFSALMEVSPSKVRLSNAKSRWGCCNHRDCLSFSWRLVFCPMQVIDYVVVHELSHISHKNHGPLFWKRVERFVPDYKRRRKWLKDNSGLMSI